MGMKRIDRAIWKSLIVNFAINAVWYALEWYQYGELQWYQWGGQRGWNYLYDFDCMALLQTRKQGITMPRFNVEADGEWACFSSVVDAFITPFMQKEEYEKWRADEYGEENVPLEKANKMSLKEALFDLSLNKTDDEIIRNLREAGLIDSREGDEL